MSQIFKEIIRMNEMTLILERATARGVRRGLDDQCDDVYNESPLSGEWAGESVEELLGDLIDMSHVVTGDEMTDIICDHYLAGYDSVFSND